MSEVFNKLYAIDVNERTENKNGLSYLSWAWAWAEVKKQYPDAEYDFKTFGEEEKPYLFDENLGYMVFTSVTIEGLTHEMWLPVMDYQNQAMKNQPYQAKIGKRTINIQPATMFDINKAIMRCLTKNLAMFGLGLYIYAGEDLPEPPKVEYIDKEEIKVINQKIDRVAEVTDGDKGKNRDKMIRWTLGKAGASSIQEIPKEAFAGLIEKLDNLIKKYEPTEEPQSEQDSLFEGNTTKAKGSD
jgi:hypothetical protein